MDIIAGASALADVTMNYGIGVLLLAVVGSFKVGALARLLLFEFEAGCVFSGCTSVTLPTTQR